MLRRRGSLEPCGSKFFNPTFHTLSPLSRLAGALRVEIIDYGFKLTVSIVEARWSLAGRNLTVCSGHFHFQVEARWSRAGRN